MGLDEDNDIGCFFSFHDGLGVWTCQDQTDHSLITDYFEQGFGLILIFFWMVLGVSEQKPIDLGGKQSGSFWLVISKAAGFCHLCKCLQIK